MKSFESWAFLGQPSLTAWLTFRLCMFIDDCWPKNAHIFSIQDENLTISMVQWYSVTLEKDCDVPRCYCIHWSIQNVCQANSGVMCSCLESPKKGRHVQGWQSPEEGNKNSEGLGIQIRYSLTHWEIGQPWFIYMGCDIPNWKDTITRAILMHNFKSNRYPF